ncbi:MAG: tetracycline resistance efflux pump [Enterobacterales bacterium]
MEEYGAISLIPAIIVLIVAITTHRTIAAVTTGALVAFFIAEGFGFITALSESLLVVMQDENTGWVLMVCGLYGSFIALLVRAGGARAFGDLVTKRVQSKKGALLSTWALGLVIFLDDYLNALTVSSSMKKVTDKYKTSREMLSYVVDSTAAPTCLLVPISTWAVYFSGLLEKNGVALEGEGINLFIQSIPYMFYPIVALAIVPLVIMGAIPLMGTMKSAELRAETTGQLAPPDTSTDIELEEVYHSDAQAKNVNVSLFFIPLAVLISVTIMSDIDLLVGVIAAILVTIVQYLLTRTLTLYEMFDTIMDGLRTMLPVLTILVSVFVFIEANNALGFTEYVVSSVAPYMTAKMLPFLVFITMAFVSFTTGSNWGIFAIAIPVVFPLAQELDVSIPLMAGALFSASGFGSQACFYSDSTVLAAQGSGCPSYEHALSQLPYALLGAAISAVGFLIVS